MMFWGLIMEPQKRYTQKVEKAFHISMAAVDISTSSEESSQVMCGFEGRNYLLCTLRKPDVMQVPLDLNFTVGSELSFAANGKCHVHLTGYLIDDFPELPEMEEVEEEEEDEVEQKVKQKRRKRNNKGVENGPPVKKSKAVSSQNENADEGGDEDDEGEDSDNSLNISTLLGKTLEDDDDDDNTFVEEEEEDGSEEDTEGEESEDEVFEEEADSDDDEAEDVSSLSEVESEEENQSSPLVKVNGITNKKQKKKQEPTTPKQNKEGKLQKDKTPKDNKSPKETKGKTPEKSSQSPQKKTLQGGVHIQDLKEGQGPVAKSGKFVTVYYEGRLKQNNKVFDATNKGNGFSFRLGSGEVIKGWDVGVAGMRVGGKRRIVCPPGMAYGAKGSPPAIPANSTLIFEVELRKIR